MIGLDRLISRQLRVRARPDFDLVAVGKIGERLYLPTRRRYRQPLAR